MPQKPGGPRPLTSLCSMQILQSHMGCGRLLEVSTPHLVQTFWGQNRVQCILRYARLEAAAERRQWLGEGGDGGPLSLGDCKKLELSFSYLLSMTKAS